MHIMTNVPAQRMFFNSVQASVKSYWAIDFKILYNRFTFLVFTSDDISNGVPTYLLTFYNIGTRAYPFKISA